MKTVFITGTSSGMGAELVSQFARRGWNIAATMRDPATAERTWADSPQVAVLPLDVTRPETIDAAVAEATTRFGQIDVLINNAGFAQVGTLEEASLQQWRAQYETNVFGVVAVTKAVLPQMRARRDGHIVMISSMGGQVALPTMSVYTSSKFALEGLSEGLAKEIAPIGIDVTIVEPAGFSTPFHQKVRRTDLLADYDAARDEMAAFARKSVHGNLERAMSAVAEVAGTENPPLRLALGTFGLWMVRDKLASLENTYAAWETVTKETD